MASTYQDARRCQGTGIEATIGHIQDTHLVRQKGVLRMRIKTFKSITLEELELEMNIWLKNNSYRVARISHAEGPNGYSCMVLYQAIVVA